MVSPRILACLVATLLLTACSSGPVPTPKGDGEPEAPQSRAEAPQPAPSSPSRPVPEVLAQSVTGALERITFQAGETVGSGGVYFLNVATGTGEGWTHPAVPFFGTTHVSDDNRFAIASTMDSGYVVDRQNGTIWEWDPKQVQALLASAYGFLFAETEILTDAGTRTVHTGRYFWAGPDFRPKLSFTVGGAGGWGSSQLLSPDGSRIALLRRGDAKEPTQAALVNLTSGEVRQLPLPDVEYLGSAGVQRHGDQFQVTVLERTGPELMPTWHEVRRGFDWTGETTGDLRIPGNYAVFSPDGNWVAWEEWTGGGLAPVTVVAHWRRFRFDPSPGPPNANLAPEPTSRSPS